MTDLAALKESIETALADSIPATSHIAPRLAQAMRYALLGGGKRLRPLFTCVVAATFGAPVERALAAACAVEMVHAYSLVHDDLPAMDDDNLRHGKPTVHVAFDEWTAVLVGDALLTLAFETLATMPETSAEQRLQCSLLLARAAGWQGMVAGQALDMGLAAADANVQDLATLETLHAAKTGALIRASIELGGVIAAVDTGTLTSLRRIADHVGLAFQIMDDVLDVTASTETLGKPAGSDVRGNKQTFVTFLGLDAARQRAEGLMTEAHALLAALPGDTNALRALTTLAVRRTF
ncbi:MAG: polyprenyl synthetase family protein [Pseudomonadales bacterium]